MKKFIHPAEKFNKIRRIIYSTFHKDGKELALKYLDGYEKSLGPKGYIGLKTEVNFYIRNQSILNLTVAADVGDHTDFSGILDNKAFKIDVTSNLKYKELKTYEPLQKSAEAKYKIILANEDGEIDEIIDINFPFCPHCNIGRLIDIGALMSATKSSDLDFPTEHNQFHMGVCNNCDYFKTYNTIISPFLPTFNEECGFHAFEIMKYNNAVEEIGEFSDFDPKKYINLHVENVLPYLNSMFNYKMMALGDLEILSGTHSYIEIKWQKKIRLLKEYIKNDYKITKLS
jgi:predicted nucleic-acid-binding Zn-ribbon protein